MSEIHSVEREELMAYLDGELSAVRAVEVAAHVEGCPECRQFAAELGDVSQSLRAWDVEPADAGMPARVAGALREQSGKARKRPWISRYAWALGLAVCSLVLFVTWPHAHFMRVPGMHAKPFRQQAATPARSPMIERRAQMVLTASDFDNARAGLELIVRRHAGYIDAMNVNSAAASRGLDAMVRVPVDQLDAVLKELKSLGRVEQESQSGEDVTKQFVDLEARLANARNTEKRLTDLLRQRTGTLSDVLEVERELSRVRGEIEQMEAQRKNIANLVAYATVDLKIMEQYKAQLGGAPESTLMRFRNAGVEGFRTAISGFVSVLLLLISYGPALVLWTLVLYFPVRFAWRKLSRSGAQL
jgi:hypothetical protein